jgi:hypothetical protein
MVLHIVSGPASASDQALAGAEGITIAQTTGTAGSPVPLWLPRAGTKATGAGGQPAAVPATPSSKTITVDQLTTPDSETVGTLESEMGGLGLEMWSGTPRSLIDGLLPQLPIAIRSPTMRDLARRLLLSTAVVPPRDGAESDEKSLIAMRVEQLQAMGLIGAAAELISAAPTRDSDPDLLRAKVDNLLLFNDLGGACNVVRRQGNRLVEGYWQRSLVFCQALEGNVDGAALGANLLAEGGEIDDPAFFALVDALTNGRSVTVESLTRPTPLHLAMLRTANLHIPPNALDRESPALLRAIGISPNAASDLRLDAAEWAAVMGAVPPGRLGQVYAGAEFEVDELDNALSSADAQRNSRGRALLYQAAAVQNVPMAKAAVLQQAWQLAREDNLYSLAVRLYEPMILETPPLSGLGWFAADAARALFALRRSVAAQPWLTLLRQETLRDPDAKRAADALWPIIEVAGNIDVAILDPASLTAWQAAQREISPESANARIALGFAMFEALGYELDPENWRTLLSEITWSGKSVPGAAWRRALRDASEAGRIGETVLLALLVLGREGPEGADIWHLHDLLVALRTIGLETEARALALEAMLAAGL